MTQAKKLEKTIRPRARKTGESCTSARRQVLPATKTEAVTRALRDRLARLRRERAGRRLADELDEIARHCARLPATDRRTPDEIIGYDERGLPS